MRSHTRNEYVSCREWFRAVLQDERVVLRHTSALECLQLFGGYLDEAQIDVYATEQGRHENVTYHIVETFDCLDIVEVGGLRCTSVSQTVNDMLQEFDHIDEQSLIEALSHYYFSCGESFDRLRIQPPHRERFHRIKDWAIQYYLGA